MGNVVIFKSRADLDASGNLFCFIKLCREELTTFGRGLDFDCDVWNVTAEARLKARNTAYYLHFTGYPTLAAKKDGEKMSEPFKSFSKAYVRYFYSISLSKVTSEIISTLRALYQAIRELDGNMSPVYLTLRHFHRASLILRARYKDCYSEQKRLEHISIFLAENRLVINPVIWHSSEKTQHLTTSRVGPEFDAKRKALLPSPLALQAIAEIFNFSSDLSDIFVTSVCAILTSAPSRISEVLSLSVDCEVELINSEGEKVYGLRWIPSKGGEPLVKWVVPAMVDVVRKAVANLRAQSAEARQLAEWYEVNNDRMYLPAHLEYLRDSVRLTFREVALVVFRDSEEVANLELLGAKWCAHNKIDFGVGGESSPSIRLKTVAFNDVQKVILSHLPKGFPIANVETGLRYSDAICLSLKNLLSKHRRVYRCAFLLADYGVFKSRLSGVRGGKSMFERHNYKDDAGNFVTMNSHQIRHYLNTLAQMGGLGQLDIAKWSGRINVSQNSSYNHESDRDILAKVRSAIGDGGKIFGPLATAPDRKLIDRKTFSALKVVTAHVTEFGYCIHDYSMLPCQVHRDCINCDEQVCIKGDAEKERALRQCQSETRTLLDKARLAQGEGEFGANRWVEHQALTLSRLDQICSILDDADVPVGSIIQPSGVVPASRLEKPGTSGKNLMTDKNKIS